VIDSLQKLRAAHDEIHRLTAEDDLEQLQWRTTRVHHKRRMVGEEAEDDVAATPEDAWLRETFYVVIDQILQSMTERFDKSMFQELAVFSPNQFPDFLRRYKTAHDLQTLAPLKSFCEKYDLDLVACADELYSFANVYSRFDSNLFNSASEADDDDLLNQAMQQFDADINDKVEQSNKRSEELTEENSEKHKSSFSNALAILCNPMYHLNDAYPQLCRVFSIAVAIPISSCTAERSFSALKRIKTRLRSTMVQDRLEGLLLMSVERKVMMTVETKVIIDEFARSSTELSRALLLV
jgi:hypothetical protein